MYTRAVAAVVVLRVELAHHPPIPSASVEWVPEWFDPVCASEVLKGRPMSGLHHGQALRFVTSKYSAEVPAVEGVMASRAPSSTEDSAVSR